MNSKIMVAIKGKDKAFLKDVAERRGTTVSGLTRMILLEFLSGFNENKEVSSQNE